MGNLAIFVRYGVELRVFLNEFTRERVDGAILLHTVRDSVLLGEYAREFNLKLVHVSGLTEKLNRWGELFNVSRLAANRLSNRINYKHYSEANNHPSVFDRLKGNRVTFSFFKWMYFRSSRQDIPERLINTLRAANVSHVWFNGYSSPVNLSMAMAAKMAGCHTLCYINSWKDLYVNNYVSRFFDEVLVWSEGMKEAYLAANPSLRERRVTVAGNPRLTALSRHKVSCDPHFYQKKYELHSTSYILYTGINPKVYDDEPRLVGLIHDELEKGLGEKCPGILIKPNPMDSNPERWAGLASKENVGIIRAGWEWKPHADFNLPSFAADREWFDLLHYCDCTMNVASTVTVESLTCGKPVINIGFDHTGVGSEIFARYSHAPFYNPLLARRDVHLVAEPQNLAVAYIKCANNQSIDDLDEVIQL